MSDPRPLIEHVGEMLVERETRIVRVGDDERETQLDTIGKSALLLNLMRSLYAEVDMPLESKPHHNKMFNFYSHEQDDMCGRARDKTPIEIPSQLYEFGFLRESLLPGNVNWGVQAGRNCIVMICDIPPSVAESILLTCQQISQNQSITDLWINKLRCDTFHTVPADVFNLGKTTQSVTIVNSTLPRDLMEHLMSQLPQCMYLKKVHIQNIILYDSLSTEMSQGEISDTKMFAESSKAQDQVSKWELKYGTTNLEGLQGNCLLSGDKVLFLSQCKMLTHLNLNGSKLGKAVGHIIEILNSFGLDSPLQSLYLRNCSIPTDTLREILKSLKKCKQLIHLDLGGHNLENAGEYLVELIKSFRVDPPLQQLYIDHCSIQEIESTEMLKYLSKYRHLTHLNLNGNRLAKGGMHIADMVDRLDVYSPLQLLYLRNCSIPTDTLQEILKSLKKCKQLIHLDLGGHNLESVAEHLVQLIRSFRVDQPLQTLLLQDCSIQEKECTEMLQYLSEFRHLTNLNLIGNMLGKGGIHIVEMIERTGLDSPLQSLYLNDCSIPTDTLREILKCLKKCKQLTHLDLGGHDLESVAEHLVELIQSFRVDPPLQTLYLPNCSIQEKECTEMLQYLSEFRHLTHLNLTGNMLGKGGIHIVEMIERTGLDSPLQLLYLNDCSIPTDTLREILKCLKKCKQLTHLDLGGHNLESVAEHLVELIRSFRVDQPLQTLLLRDCSIQEKECTEMLQYLCESRHLTHLNLSGNRVGKGGIHIVEIVDILDSGFELLYLRDCSIPTDTLREILKCLKKCKQLTHLDLGGHDLESVAEHLVELIQSFRVDPPLQTLYLPNCSIQEKECTEMLQYLSEFRHLTHLNLIGNMLGKGGIHIVEMIERTGLDSPLQLLYLNDCSIPTDTLREILKCLKKCKQLTHLDLGGHNLESVAEHLVELIRSFRVDQPLQTLLL